MTHNTSNKISVTDNNNQARPPFKGEQDTLFGPADQLRVDRGYIIHYTPLREVIVKTNPCPYDNQIFYNKSSWESFKSYKQLIPKWSDEPTAVRARRARNAPEITWPTAGARCEIAAKQRLPKLLHKHYVNTAQHYQTTWTTSAGNTVAHAGRDTKYQHIYLSFDEANWSVFLPISLRKLTKETTLFMLNYMKKRYAKNWDTVNEQSL